MVASSALGQELAVSIQGPTEAIHVGEYPKFGVAIKNQGSKPRTPVLPGDGSECKWRTPGNWARMAKLQCWQI